MTDFAAGSATSASSTSPSHSEFEWDVVIIGAGPAGLSAALVLGRCCRRVLICDRGTPRSWASHAMHGFISRDGVPPDQFRSHAHEELQRYPTVQFRAAAATRAERVPSNGFLVELAGGERVTARKLLLATGLFDELPPIAGVEEYFGRSVFSCPYCDGWEMRDSPIVVFGRGARGVEMARSMTAWTRQITLCTHGHADLPQDDLQALIRNGIRVERSPVTGLDGAEGKLSRVLLKSGESLECRALFFNLPCRPQSELARMLGCQFNSKGGIRCGQYEASSVPGVFVAGNILKDVQLSIVAAAEGAKAAFGINRSLTREDFAHRAGAPGVVDHPGPQSSA